MFFDLSNKCGCIVASILLSALFENIAVLAVDTRARHRRGFGVVIVEADRDIAVFNEETKLLTLGSIDFSIARLLDLAAERDKTFRDLLTHHTWRGIAVIERERYLATRIRLEGYIDVERLPRH